MKSGKRDSRDEMVKIIEALLTDPEADVLLDKVKKVIDLHVMIKSQKGKK